MKFSNHCLAAMLIAMSSYGVTYAADETAVGTEASSESGSDMTVSEESGSDIRKGSETYIQGPTKAETLKSPSDAYFVYGEDKEPAWKRWGRKIRAVGAIQTEFLIPYDLKGERTDKDRPLKYDKDVLNNTYFDLTVNAPYISIGARFQWTKWPLPGYEDDFKGWGVPYIWATGSYKWAQLTAGDFYEQFGSGLILRTYQERSIGIDNAIRGGRLKLNPIRGLNITLLGGKQRHYWDWNKAWLWGGDAEWSVSESFKNLFPYNKGLSLGFSYVGKHEESTKYRPYSLAPYSLVFPKTVAAFDGRVKAKLNDFDILAEFATKNNDPSADNGYTYRRGHAELLTVSYASNGFSAYIQGKRSDNMSWRSDRNVEGTSSFINHLPAFTMTQTYALAAMYPYATQADGEWAFQGEVRYLFKKRTPLGGKYGTSVRLSASYISGLDRIPNKGVNTYKPFGDVDMTNPATLLPMTNGYGAAFWKIGKLYYADLNFELNKKLSRKFQFTFFYLFQKYDQMVIQGHGGMVTANTFIFEGQNKLGKKTQLRYEAQYLYTDEDKGDWLSGLVELSLAPHWMFTVSDTYNCRNNDNFYQVLVTYNYRANRFTLGYGRIREGYNCSGGVCRWVPETKGFNVTYNFTF